MGSERGGVVRRTSVYDVISITVVVVFTHSPVGQVVRRESRVSLSERRIDDEF